MLGRFLSPGAAELIGALDLDPSVRRHALDVVRQGYAVIPGAVALRACADAIARFRAFERANEAIFAENRDDFGHYPRIVNLHNVMPELCHLFTRNSVLLATLDALFGARASLYTSLFYETGSQQPLHRDTPVFATRPEYLYFGTTVYLEPAGEENGCLEVVPGGHAIPELDREAMALRRYGSLADIPAIDGEAWNEYQSTVVSRCEAAGLRSRAVPVEAGDTIIWHPQLPHGGTPIRDRSRTRLSLVMHVTPEGVPVYHQNVFFAPRVAFPEVPPWGYYDIDGRKIADHRSQVSFGHVHDYRVERFVRPVAESA